MGARARPRKYMEVVRTFQNRFSQNKSTHPHPLMRPKNGIRGWGASEFAGRGLGDPEKNRFLGGSGPKRHRGARVGARRPGFLSRDVAGATFEGGTGKGPGAVAGSARGRPSVKTAESGRDGPRQGQDTRILASGRGPGPYQNKTPRRQTSVKDLSLVVVVVGVSYIYSLHISAVLVS